jgi:hypothetical protein
MIANATEHIQNERNRKTSISLESGTNSSKSTSAAPAYQVALEIR